jgi:phage-related protein
MGSSLEDVRAFPVVARREAGFASRAEAVYVLHAFSKKTAKTSQRGLQVARDRLRSLLR